MELAIWAVAAFVLLNILGFIAAALDKRAAGRGERRVAELTFCLLAWVGAWPGIVFAFVLLRHKTRKTRFLVPFTIAILANVVLLASFAWLAWRS
ncbi:MAG: DUF1294 domain-containing protein [Candidatus Thermoplasmatota archaeon]